MCDCRDCEEERIIKRKKCNCRKCERNNRCTEKHKEKHYHKQHYECRCQESRCQESRCQESRCQESKCQESKYENIIDKCKDKNEKIIIITIT